MSQPTTPEFQDNFVAAPPGVTPDVGVKQGEDIVIKNSEGADYMFYGLLESIGADGSRSVISVAWDGFTDPVKDGILIIHTQKSVTVRDASGTPKQVDINLPTGHYRIVLRDDPTPFGQILGETDDFSIF